MFQSRKRLYAFAGACLVFLWFYVSILPNYTLGISSKCYRPTMLSASDARFYDNVKNYVGSLHHYEPNLQIVIYDLGLTDEQRNDMVKWRNVEVRTFDYDRYPEHVKNKKTFAWKPLLIKDALTQSDCVLYLDSR